MNPKHGGSLRNDLFKTGIATKLFTNRYFDQHFLYTHYSRGEDIFWYSCHAITFACFCSKVFEFFFLKIHFFFQNYKVGSICRKFLIFLFEIWLFLVQTANIFRNINCLNCSSSDKKCFPTYDISLICKFFFQQKLSKMLQTYVIKAHHVPNWA